MLPRCDAIAPTMTRRASALLLEVRIINGRAEQRIAVGPEVLAA
jgi:hypothetical protein